MKKLLAFVLATAMALSMAACGGAKDSSGSNTAEPSNDKVYELKLAGSMPTDSPSSQGMERIKAYCEEKSGGRLKITTYPANQLGDSTLVIEDIMAGNVDMGCFFIGTSYDARIAINSLPYLATSVEDAKRTYSPGSHYFDAYSKVLADLDIKHWVPYKLFIDPLDYTISQKTWDSLPEDLQQIIQDAVTEVTNQQFENMETLDQEYLDKMVGQGCEVLPLTDEEFNSFVDKNAAYYGPEDSLCGLSASHCHRIFRYGCIRSLLGSLLHFQGVF